MAKICECHPQTLLQTTVYCVFFKCSQQKMCMFPEMVVSKYAPHQPLTTLALFLETEDTMWSALEHTEINRIPFKSKCV